MLSSVFLSLEHRMRYGDSWTRWLIATGVVFGGLLIAQSYGASWAMPVALLVFAGVLVVNEGKK